MTKDNTNTIEAINEIFDMTEGEYKAGVPMYQRRLAHQESMHKLIQDEISKAKVEALNKYLRSVPVDSPGYEYIKSGIEREIHFINDYRSK